MTNYQKLNVDSGCWVLFFLQQHQTPNSTLTHSFGIKFIFVISVCSLGQMATNEEAPAAFWFHVHK